MLNYQRVSWYIPTNIALKHGPYESTHAETLRMGDAREHLELFDGTHLVQRWQLGSVSICGPYYLLYDLYNSMYIYINYIYICIHISNIHIKYIYIYYWRTLTSPVIMGWFSPVQVFWNNLCFASETSILITKAGGEVDTFGVESNPAQRKLWWIARNMTYEYIWFSYDVLWESLNSKLSKPSPKVITIFYGIPTIPTFSSTVVMAVSARWGLCRESSQRHVGLQQRELMSWMDPPSANLP